MGNTKSLNQLPVAKIQEEEYFGHYGNRVPRTNRSGCSYSGTFTSKNSVNSLVYRGNHPSNSKYISSESNDAKQVISASSDVEIGNFMDYEDQFEYLNNYINTHSNILTHGQQDSINNCTLVNNEENSIKNENDKSFTDKTDMDADSAVSNPNYEQPLSKNCIIDDSFDGVTKNDEYRLIYSTINIPDGSTHKGQWLNGLQHGLGSETWADGATYHGDYMYGKKHGFGQFCWPNGNLYIGKFFEGQINGVGTFIWNQGKKYTGEWKDNQMHGQGEYIWPDGRIYRGEFVNGKRHGVGLFEWGDGRKYQGGFKNGIQHGTGVYFNTKGMVKHGVWSNGKNTKWFDPNSDANDQCVNVSNGCNGKIKLTKFNNISNDIRMDLPFSDGGKNEDEERIFK